MRRMISVFALLALTASLAAQKQTIKVSTDSVAVYVTVTDTDKRLVPDLLLEDFEILDNGKPVNITVFENKPVPITAVVMIDTSGSITASLGLVKDGAEQFLLRLLPDDRAQVGEFSDKIKFHPGSFIDDRDRLIYLLKHELDFGYPTRLYDAVDQSIERLVPVDGSHEAAASHSCSVGRRAPAHLQYASASYQQTWQTGRPGSTSISRSIDRVIQAPSSRVQNWGATRPASWRHAHPASVHSSGRP